MTCCFKCKSRHLGCHAICKKYKDEQNKLTIQKQYLKEEKLKIPIYFQNNRKNIDIFKN